jgi:hypothetical protein
LERAARLLAGALLVATSGCPGTTPLTAAGTATFSDAITGSVLVVPGATYSSAGGLRFFIQSPAGDYPALTFQAALPGNALQTLTYDDSNGTAASTTVQEAATGGVSWTQVSTDDTQAGTFSLALTDAGVAEVTDGGTCWPAPQGSLTATLVPMGTLTDAGLTVYVNFNPAAGKVCP